MCVCVCVCVCVCMCINVQKCGMHVCFVNKKKTKNISLCVAHQKLQKVAAILGILLDNIEHHVAMVAVPKPVDNISHFLGNDSFQLREGGLGCAQALFI